MSTLANEKFTPKFHGMVEPGVRMFWLIEDKVSLVAPTTEDAKRVAACWNACAGIRTEDLERYYGAGGGVDDALNEASLIDHVNSMRQRDELLAALKELSRAYVRMMEIGRDRIRDLGGDCDCVKIMERNDPELRKARATIAKAECA